MNRREALRRVALLTGAAVSMPLAAAILQGCESETGSETGEGLKYLTQKQFDVLNEFAERIIPKTDTPGAKDAGVANFIDKMLGEFYPAEDSKKFANGIDVFEADCEKTNGKSFTEMADNDRDAYLTTIEDKAFKDRDAGTATNDIFWFTAKQGVLSAFLYRKLE
ncbi:MAG: gluconate 2-dehydrogenase subunit 3 family protein [Saprospiraceae bacterium]|nr:gluconate 2-dehydrogenase subunit 3 family protein [Saprospiraceae bacterium]